MCRLYPNSMPFYIRELSIHGFWFPCGVPGTSPLWIPNVSLCICPIECTTPRVYPNVNDENDKNGNNGVGGIQIDHNSSVSPHQAQTKIQSLSYVWFMRSAGSVPCPPLQHFSCSPDPSLFSNHAGLCALLTSRPLLFFSLLLRNLCSQNFCRASFLNFVRHCPDVHLLNNNKKNFLCLSKIGHFFPVNFFYKIYQYWKLHYMLVLLG